MREIEFRAKDIKEGKWRFGFYAFHKDSFRRRETHLIYSPFCDSEGETFYPDSYPVDPETVGQFTGVMDINGKKIYEGDIVRYRCTDERYTRNPEYTVDIVTWNKWDSGWGLGKMFKPIFSGKRLEVLGNIHDTPDWKERFLK